MRTFYSRLGASGPSEALASAQRAMLSGRDKTLSHPWHWAAFVLVGEAPQEKPATDLADVSVKARQEDTP
jgi:CHAT domain-containing protein